MELNRTGKELTKELVQTVLDTVDAGLVQGLGKPEPGRMCVEAAICFALGLPHNDNPPCVGGAVRSFKIALNDARWSSDKARAKGMRRLAVLQLGSDSIDQQAFAEMVTLRIINEVLPPVFKQLDIDSCGMGSAGNLAEAAAATTAAGAAVRVAATTAAAAAARAAARAAEAAWAAAWAAAAAQAAAWAAEAAEAAEAAWAEAAAAARAAAAATAEAEAAEAEAAEAQAATTATTAAAAARAAAAATAEAEAAEEDAILLQAARIAEEVLIALGSPGAEADGVLI